DLHAQIKAGYPFRNLSRVQFDLVLNMLGGRYADNRVRELRTRLSIDRIDNTVIARKGALLSLYMSGGTIPDRGYFNLRHDDTNSRIGDLDEEFVWEATLGQTFTLGTQNWRIQRITHNDVFVLPANPKSMAAPFWKAEEFGRDFHFSNMIGRFLEIANNRLDDPEFPAVLQRENCMDEVAADQLIEYLKKQREATKTDLPHRHHLMVEYVQTGPGGVPGNQVVLHTFWGGRVNRPLAMALDAAWEARFGERLEVFSSNDCIIILLPHEIRTEELLSLVTSSNIEALLRERLESSGFFGARFRECAGRALILTKSKMSQRMPLWMSRLRSQKLMASIRKYDDFPILLEAWRTCLQDEFDLESLKTLLAEIESGVITWSETYTTNPSPMARSVTFRQINEYMYMSDEPRLGGSSQLRPDLLRDVVFTPGLRPTLNSELVRDFELKRQRLSPGYSPSAPRDLIDWVKERLVIPEQEWQSLIEALKIDQETEPEIILGQVLDRIVRVEFSEISEPLIIALENLPRIAYALWGGTDNLKIRNILTSDLVSNPGENYISDTDEDTDEVLTAILGEWLAFYGPTDAGFILSTLGLEKGRVFPALEDLLDSQRLITGELVNNGADDAVCDSENFEILLRLSRAEAVPAFEPLEMKWLPLFLALFQGLADPEDSVEGLYRRLEQLLCYRLPAGQWESDILPARLPSYSASWLDGVMQESDLRWIGSGNREVAFCFEPDLDLIADGTEGPGQDNNQENSSKGVYREQPERPDTGLDDLFTDRRGRYDFWSLQRASKLGPAELADRLWEEVWQGRVTNDTFISLRRGIENRFKVPALALIGADETRPGQGPRRRARFSRWKGSLPFAGNWFDLDRFEMSDDLIEVEERNKDRVRILLDRYGILFREMLSKEMTPFNWPDLFRSLRLMELSGEVLAGYFFHGIPGPQFISHQAFRSLQRQLPDDKVFWINATDPVSLCGRGLEELRGRLPRRLDSTHLVYRGPELVLVSERNGKALTFNVLPDDPDIQYFLSPLRHLLQRGFMPHKRIQIETINGDEASKSPYVEVLRTGFELMVETRGVTLYRKVV
ncbi:MAG: hypothetical protein V3V52_12420, partial [Candidatus Adiutricales bacterium]